MSRLTGNEVQNLMEAYSSVYAPQGYLTEEQFYNEVHYVVNEIIDEGYDLSCFTWDDIYNFAEECLLYEDEVGRSARQFGQQLGTGIRSAASNVGNAISGAAKGYADVLGSYGRGLVGKETTSQNPISRAANTVSRTITAPARAYVRAQQGIAQGLAGGVPNKPGGLVADVRPGSTTKPTPQKPRSSGEALVGSATRPGGLRVTDTTLRQAQQINRAGGMQTSTGQSGFLAQRGDRFVIVPRKGIGADDSLVGKAARALGLTRQQDLATQRSQQAAARRNRESYLGPKNQGAGRPPTGLGQDLTRSNVRAYMPSGGKLGGKPTGSALGKTPKGNPPTKK